jgi:hypothetical protein
MMLRLLGVNLGHVGGHLGRCAMPMSFLGPRAILGQCWAEVEAHFHAKMADAEPFVLAVLSHVEVVLRPTCWDLPGPAVTL